jgi:hypothetical protein
MALTTENGEVSAGTTFHYHQDGKVISAEYGGGTIVAGHSVIEEVVLEASRSRQA